MDDSVMNIGKEVQQAQNGMTVGTAVPEPAPAQGPEGKQEPEAKQPVKQMNPALKYGRRMDYKTAKVSEKPSRFQNRPLVPMNNVQSTASPSPAPAPSVPAPSANNGQSVSPMSSAGAQNAVDEPKSALELELEAIEAAKTAQQPIHNPLPTPKKRVPKEMEFDIEPSEYEMHFDLVELNGRDFFDIN